MTKKMEDLICKLYQQSGNAVDVVHELHPEHVPDGIARVSGFRAEYRDILDVLHSSGLMALRKSNRTPQRRQTTDGLTPELRAAKEKEMKGIWDRTKG